MRVFFIVIIIIIFTFYFILKNTINYNKMKIISPVFANNSYIPSKYSCDGEKINPSLNFLEIPKNTKSLALIVDDPDAPMGTFVHWVIYNILPNTSGVGENTNIKNSAMGINSLNKIDYVPMCPPNGMHRYFFKLYALDTILNLEKNTDKKTLELAMQNHIIEKAELIGLYKQN